MKIIKIKAVSNFTPAMEKLRRKGYGGNNSRAFSGDEFDANSVHVTASCEGELIGMIRLTMSSVSVIQSLLNKNYSMLGQFGAAELTRAVVCRRWRGRNIFKLLMAEALMTAAKLGADKAVSIVEPDAAHLEFLRTIDFYDLGDLVLANNRPKGEVVAQIIAKSLDEDMGKIFDTRAQVISCERLKNFRIVSEIFERAAIA